MRVVHYLNQFFGGLGGEERTGAGVTVRPGAVGPGIALARLGGIEVVATVICGDTYAAENLDRLGDDVVAAVSDFKPDAVLAGPAFHAGRYGLACAHVCQQVQAQAGIPAVTGLHPENAAVELYRRSVYIVPTSERAADMDSALRGMVALAQKLAAGAALGPAEAEGYLPRGVRRNLRADVTGGERAVAMLVRQLTGQPWTTELALPAFDRITPAPAVDPAKVTVALVTTGGLVPRGNPDRMPVGRSTTYFRYDMSGLAAFHSGEHEGHHQGYETKYVDADPNRIVPLDVVRAMEQEGGIGRLHPEFLTCSGQNAMFQSATNIGRSMAAELRAKGAGAVILTST